MLDSLTHAEEQIMLKLWELKQASVKDILLLFPEPRPAYNTVSTTIRILEKKGVVHHIKKGRGFEYVPSLTKEEYRKKLLTHLLENFYNNDFQLFNSEINVTKTLDLLL